MAKAVWTIGLAIILAGLVLLARTPNAPTWLLTIMCCGTFLVILFTASKIFGQEGKQ